jgi:ribosomal protein S18 acetylase RimI-like enzyme
MIIRPYQPADLPTLKAITVGAFAGVSIDYGVEEQFGPINGHDWQWRKARHIDDDVARDPAGIFVAVLSPSPLVGEGLGVRGQSETVVGYITTWQDRESGIGHIPNIAIAPEFRGQGLGRLLIQHALAHFRASGLTHAKIETLAQNSVGNHLYRDLGFVEVARQVHFVARL